MIKKLISFACCLLPMGAGAAVVVNPDGSNAFVSTAQDAWVNAGTSSITINSPQVISLVANNGFDLAGNMYVGVSNDQGSQTGNLYVLDTVGNGTNSFTVSNGGNVSVATMLQVLDGWTLGLQGVGANAAFDFGSIDNNGAIIAKNVSVFTSGAIENDGVLDLDVLGGITTGVLSSNSGSFSIKSGGAVDMAGVVNSANSDSLINAADDINFANDVQNNTGGLDIVAGGDVTVGGSVYNSGNSMGVTGGVLNVTGTMKNDSQNGTVTLNLDGFTVNGGTEGTFSLVNNGNFYATVYGDTYLEYGMNLSGMGVDNEFSLDTGTLSFGDAASSNTWFSAFANKLENFNLAVRDGDINLNSSATGILNGAENNTDANMQLLAQNVYVTNVRNNGSSLIIKAADLDDGYDVVAPAMATMVGNIVVGDQVVGAAGSNTQLIASNALNVQGGVANSGAMTLNSNSVEIVSGVSNSGVGAVLNITSLTDKSGTVIIDGNLTNTDGLVNVNAKNVGIGGTLVNSSGTVNVTGSDLDGGSVYFGGINANGGVINLDALAGNVAVNSAIIVSNGALNLGGGIRNLDVDGAVQIDGNLTASANAAVGSGDVNVAATGTVPFVMNSSAVVVKGDVDVTDDAVVRNVQLDSSLVSVEGNVDVANKGYLTLGASGNSAVVNVGQSVNVSNSGTLENFANNFTAGTIGGNGLIITHGENITANAGDIDIAGGLVVDSARADLPTTGLITRDINTVNITTTAAGADIKFVTVDVASGNTLKFDAADALNIAGTIVNSGNLMADAGGVIVGGALDNKTVAVFAGQNITFAGVNNVGDLELTATDGDINLSNVTTSGDLTINGDAGALMSAYNQTDGVTDINVAAVSAQSFVVNGDVNTVANITANTMTVDGNVRVAGNVSQGGADAMLNLSIGQLNANNLMFGQDFTAVSGNVEYNIGTNVNVAGNVNVADNATSVFALGGAFGALDVNVAGDLKISAPKGITFQDVVIDGGVLTLDSGSMLVDVASVGVNGGNLVLDGAGFVTDGAIDTGAMLYQQYASELASKDINILSDKYTMTMSALDVAGINQDGHMVINTNTINVGGDIVATDLRFVAPLNDLGQTLWQNVNVGGNVSGGVEFLGLEKMTIAGDYTFDANSKINAAILPYANGLGLNTSDVNYWSTVSLNDDDTLGRITNADDGAALITVGGSFKSGVVYDDAAFGLNNTAAQLGEGQIGISLFDVVDQGTAIWLLYADNGVYNFSQLEQMRNLNVNFCNADGSICYNYLDMLDGNNGTGADGNDKEDLPAYVSVRDTDSDGTADSLYVVFDPRFGGPVLLDNMKIQPIVARESYHTTGEYVSAGALDDLLVGQVHNKKFFNRTPIEIIPLVFADSNISEMANELYNRMEYYVETSDGAPLARFSRLFQVRELEQIAGGISLNEHTTFRSFEDRMFDEFIWNRNRQLKKAWVDVDYGMFYQNIDDGKHTDGNRFAISGGFDWQETDTLVLGLTGRVSHTASAASDNMDLSYADVVQTGDVKIDVADTDIAVGGYMMKILGEKTRLYGNAFADLHFFDVNRFQTYVDTIDGDGMAFSLISEWGLMHDILNQYIVGNAYARIGYNFGFSIKEQVKDEDYMHLKSDGYMILTPGYSLTAQKKIYPSAWFQIRPYASVGVEYDVLGAPDYAEYKFSVAERFTNYDIDINPLWANIGGGVEMLSAHGLQLGLDYRYQYNQDIQLHNIKVSGSYRF